MNKDYVTRNEFNTQLAKTERVEVIYDITNQNTINGQSYTGGLTSNTPINIDASRYKYILAYGKRNGVGLGVTKVLLTGTIDSSKQAYFGSGFMGASEEGSRIYVWQVRCTVSTDKQTITAWCERLAYPNDFSRNDGEVVRLEGVLL